jgi:hypothetical protein
MPYDSDLGLFLARDPRQPLGDIWSRIKNFS